MSRLRTVTLLLLLIGLWPAPADAQSSRVEKAITEYSASLRDARDPDDASIQRVGQRMAQYGRQAEPYLRGLLRDPGPAVRQAAIVGLMRLRVPDIGEIARSAMDDPDPGVIIMGLRTLAAPKGREATAACIEAVTHDDPRVRAAALELLHRQPAAIAADQVIAKLDAAGDTETANVWIRALGHVSYVTALRRLVQVLDEDRYAPAALEALGNQGKKAAFTVQQWVQRKAAKDPEAVLPVIEIFRTWKNTGGLMMIATSGSPPLADPACEALATLGGAGAAALGQLAIHQDLALRKLALRHMKAAEEGHEGNAIIQNLGQEDPELRMLAIALATGKDARTASGALISRYRALAAQFDPAQNAERHALIAAIGRTGLAGAVPVLVEATEFDADAPAATEALGTIGEPALDALLVLARTGRTDLREHLAAAFAKIGEPAIAPLMRLLTHRRRHVRYAARQAIGALASPKTVDRIMELIGNEKTEDRAGLIAVLGKIKHKDAYRALRKLAEKVADPQLRQAAVTAIAQHEGQQVDALLRSIAATEKNDLVRQMAIRGLIRRADLQALPILSRILRYEAPLLQPVAGLGVGYLGSEEDAAELVRFGTDEALRGPVLDTLKRLTYQMSLTRPGELRAWLDARKKRTSAAPPAEPMLMMLGDGTTIAYEEMGAGAPLVVLPGGPDLGRAYLRDAMAALAATGRRIILIDLPERGESAGPPEGEPNFEHDAATVVSLLDELRVARYDLYAHEWGLPVALGVAAARPDAVGRVVLDSPPALTAAAWKKEQKAVKKHVPAPWSRDLGYLRGDDSPTNARNIARFRRRALLTGAVADVSCLADFAHLIVGDPNLRDRLLASLGKDFDLAPRVAALDHRALVLQGDAYPTSEETRAAWQKLAADDGRFLLVTIHGAGGYPFYERQNLWLSALGQFLRRR